MVSQLFLVVALSLLMSQGNLVIAAVDDPFRLVDCQPPPPTTSAAAVAGQRLAPALYVLGDSLLDSGNNNILPTLARANYPPYGGSFSNHCPTGRFTNGRTVADFIAEYLGLPYPPPFITVRTILTSNWFTTTTGFNYASGSCGILKHTGSILGKCLSLDEQLNLLNDTINHAPSLTTSYPNPTQLSNYLSKSIFLIAVGNNDYINGYFDPISNLSKRYNPQQFAQLLITQLTQKLQKLYQIGARKIVLFDIGPLGCLPNMARRIEHTGQCVEEQNRIVSIYNNKLDSMLDDLRSSLLGSHFVRGHAHDLGLDAILNPSKYGLKNTITPCCESWNNDTLSCIPGLNPCNNPDDYFFWDAYHLTQTVYFTIAARCIGDSNFCTPLNLQGLIQI